MNPYRVRLETAQEDIDLGRHTLQLTPEQAETLLRMSVKARKKWAARVTRTSALKATPKQDVRDVLRRQRYTP